MEAAESATIDTADLQQVAFVDAVAVVVGKYHSDMACHLVDILK